ncbi:MAG: CHAT domain-containing protein [Gemmatimonadaceae bacterium]
MRRAVIFLTLSISTGANAQVAHLRSLIESNDSAALINEVRRRPGDARDLMGDLIVQAGRAHTIDSDSIIRVSYRLASAYSTVWDDPFPITNLARFSRMSADQRRAKISADSLRLAGNRAFGKKGVNAAVALWRDAIRRSRAIADTPGVAAATGNIGSAFYHAGELDSAQLYLTRAREIAESIGDRRTAGNALGTLGSVAKDRGDLRVAQRSYVTALELRNRIGDVEGASADHNNLGLIASSLGDANDARAHFTDALRIARDNDLEDASATALVNLGNLASNEGDYGKASKSYLEALALNRRLGNDADAALTLHNLGLLALRAGEYRTAHNRLHQALAIFLRVGTTEDLVQIRRDLASAEAAMGNLHEALVQLRRAGQLVDRMPRAYELAGAVALAEADLAVELTDFTDADRKYARAQSLYHQAGDARGEVEAREGTASLLIQREQYPAAEAQLEAVLRAQTAAGERRSAALTRLSLGRAYQQALDTTRARRLMRQALDSLRGLGDDIGQAAAFLALGDLELATGFGLAAESQYRNGLILVKTHDVPALSWQLHAALGEALHDRGAASAAATELRAAIADVERQARSLPTAERRSIFLTDKWEPYARLALIERERGDVAAAFVASERMRSRQMLELFNRGSVALAATDSAVIERAQTLRSRIAVLTERLEKRTASGGLRGPDLADHASGVTREALAQAQGEYQHVLIELNDNRIAPSGGTDVSQWRSIAAHLAGDQALLEYLVTDSTTLVFVVKSDTIQALDLGVGRRALLTLVDFARGTLDGSNRGSSHAAWRAPLRRLYAQLIAPVEESGLLDDVHQLVIIPHADLHYLPFAALLRGPTRDEFLVQRFDIGYAPSASLWLKLNARGSSASNRVLALAPLAKTLPGSADEVVAIKSLYGTDATILSNSEATENAFRINADRFGIVHLATNGVLNRHNPLFSFVELTADPANDGRLEVHEVFGLTLHARLVVLSACQTALASGAVSDVPAGDDWVGLARAFLGAGAEHVIATLWAVEDRSTANVMRRLYERLRAGDSVVGALSEAQRQTLRNPGTSSPFYWGGFISVGGNGR